ncbi:sodium ion-translocating decarboxylase subunit beta [Clostridiisalibacter paucivorans]|uniref:sodium ion-translocating decarboxylase subunit beta n=1 Tax=Clostridiisalibacter paucivorans TaxID=408753 RepID=UPI00047D11D7|nr:sodium ion-translocating decarboxylase subunit beta [Clostridiisalibacter paucivorans]
MKKLLNINNFIKCLLFLFLCIIIANLISTYMTTRASVDIIGGADGPTAIFLTTSNNTNFIVILVLISIAIVFLYRYMRHRF